MSASRHPIALRLEKHVGGATKLLATVMALPLLDGIFVALVLAGTLASPFGIIETGLLIFGGSATMAVILAEMEGTRRQRATSVLLIGAFIVPVAAVQAALAPTLESVLSLAIFERFAGLVILAIAAKTASSQVGEWLPSPGVIIALGLVASFDPAGAEFVVSEDPLVVGRGAAAAGVGVAFALGVALASTQLRGRVNLDRFRFGSAVALGVLALPILGLLNTEAPIALAVLAVTALFAYDPDAETGEQPADFDAPDDDGPGVVASEDAEADTNGDQDPIEDGTAPSDPVTDPTGGGATRGTAAGYAASGATDGGGSGNDGVTADDGAAADNDGVADDGVTADGSDDDADESRAPWL